MASTPSYDPANFVNFNESDFINPAISTSFEPGSIFKVLVMSAAIEAGAVREDEKCDICAGPQQIAGYTIRTWDGKYHPDSTPAQIIQNSDNVGMVWVGQRLGSDRLYDYLSKFGIGEPSGIDLQGEASPKLRDKDKWGLIDLATASFGQGIAVTPIQMVRAVAAIANRGQMPTPQVVDKLVGKDWEEDIEPVLKDVISKDTANKITEMMIQAVRAGEAKWAAPKDITIAGKTGTAQIPIAGHYDPEKTIASFVGFAPAYNPAFVMLITLREPQASPWASETAAPLWFSIAKEIFPILGIQAQ
jgi:cell division protein FtsI/penicillin-binding protein 2